jgi:NADP-dependent 3-hydroxy acid dehydrogenase YdfG
MNKATSKAVRITDCSTGIGGATAEHLTGRGWNVYETARKRQKNAYRSPQACDSI